MKNLMNFFQIETQNESNKNFNSNKFKRAQISFGKLKNIQGGGDDDNVIIEEITGG